MRVLPHINGYYYPIGWWYMVNNGYRYMVINADLWLLMVMTVNVGKPMTNHPWLGMVTIQPIYCDLGDGLLLVYPHYTNIVDYTTQ